ncbi:class II aldolase/adducin family protein [Blastococcus haudaquaticus]|uniref:Class II Aldolase and Adducin N-terminal domain-containing protein n=1 Tax=Blastococcus haudaquaticus TaxID=1938745 RepID=A0A286GWH0_9ACTN|nr:class II aldolase/adducin family protein [Blastococcus haudaquaticus]SOD99404.1 Class II Aldolase and Adducin N-terminal domain-containing protein [Blastococcus haudaquaticus]
MTRADPREAVAVGCRILAAHGHADMVWGHLSVRDDAGRGLWLKRAGVGFDELVPDDVHLLSWDGELLEGDGPVHLEHHIHTEVMRARADVGAVVHSHPESAVTLAATGLPLQPLGHEGTFFTPPDVPRYTETGDLIRTGELGRSVAAALGERNALTWSTTASSSPRATSAGRSSAPC